MIDQSNAIPHVVRELYSLYRLSAVLLTSQFVVGGFAIGVSRDASHPKGLMGVLWASLIPRHRRSRAGLGLRCSSDTHTTEFVRRTYYKIIVFRYQIFSIKIRGKTYDAMAG